MKGQIWESAQVERFDNFPLSKSWIPKRLHPQSKAELELNQSPHRPAITVYITTVIDQGPRGVRPLYSWLGLCFFCQKFRDSLRKTKSKGDLCIWALHTPARVRTLKIVPAEGCGQGWVSGAVHCHYCGPWSTSPWSNWGFLWLRSLAGPLEEPVSSPSSQVSVASVA